MSLKLSLIEALVDADFVALDGCVLEKIRRSDSKIEAELVDETWRTFRRQDISIDGGGMAIAVDIDGNQVSCVFQSKVAYMGPESKAAGMGSQVEGVKLKVSLDGGVMFLDAPQGVRVIYENVNVMGEDGQAQVHITLSDEGIGATPFVVVTRTVLVDAEAAARLGLVMATKPDGGLDLGETNVEGHNGRIVPRQDV